MGKLCAKTQSYARDLSMLRWQNPQVPGTIPLWIQTQGMVVLIRTFQSQLRGSSAFASET